MQGVHLTDIKRRLKESFERIQLKHFKKELSRDYRLELSRRMRKTQGLSIPSQKVIRLSLSHLKELGWEALEATLRHEMVHCWLFERGRPWGHSPEFKAKLKEIEEDR
jgi:predicted SprT family Zn-dependent metalloprotease